MDHAAGREITIDLTDLVGEYNYKPGARAIKKSTPGVYSYDNKSGRTSTIPSGRRARHPPSGCASRPPRVPSGSRTAAVHDGAPGAIAGGVPEKSVPATRSCGKTVNGREMLLLTVTNPVGQVHDLPRPGQVVDLPHLEKRQEGRVAPVPPAQLGGGELSWVGEGALRYLLLAEAAGLRDRFVFKIFPMADPDGVARGGVRFNVNGFDLNRNWDAVDPKTMPEIAAQRKAVFDWLDSGHKFNLFYSLHNDEEPEYIESAAGPLAAQFYETLAATTSFNPNRKPVHRGVSTTPGKPGRMQRLPGAVPRPRSFLRPDGAADSVQQQAGPLSGSGRPPEVRQRAGAGNRGDPRPEPLNASRSLVF